MTRFQEELEFIQMLANPAYLSFLLQKGYFDEPLFVEYLGKLCRCWSDPRYSQFIAYPNGLLLLRLLSSSASFRQLLCSSPSFVDCIHKQQYYDWLHGAQRDQ